MKMIPAILYSELYHFDPESNMQSKQVKHPCSPPPRKFRRAHSAGKVIASTFGIVKWWSCLIILSRVARWTVHIMQANRGCYARKRRGKLTRGSCPHVTSSHDCCDWMWIWNPSSSPYSPDMTPFDFYLFPKLKSHLCCTLYGSNEGVIEAVKEYLGDQEKATYFEGIRKLQQRWAECIALKWDYIEN